MLHINVSTINFGQSDHEIVIPEVSYSVSLESISVRDVIARTVENQIETLREADARTEVEIRNALQNNYISKQEMEKQAETGKIAMPKPVKKSDADRLDVNNEIERALYAFDCGSYKVLVNGTEMTDLDQMISFNEVINVKFLRVTPLIGG